MAPQPPPVLPALTPVGQGEVLMRKLEGELGLSRENVVAFDEIIQNEKRRRNSEAQGQVRQRAQQAEALRARLEQQLDEVALEEEESATPDCRAQAPGVDLDNHDRPGDIAKPSG